MCLCFAAFVLVGIFWKCDASQFFVGRVPRNEIDFKVESGKGKCSRRGVRSLLLDANIIEKTYHPSPDKTIKLRRTRSIPRIEEPKLDIRPLHSRLPKHIHIRFRALKVPWFHTILDLKPVAVSLLRPLRKLLGEWMNDVLRGVLAID